MPGLLSRWASSLPGAPSLRNLSSWVRHHHAWLNHLSTSWNIENICWFCWQVSKCGDWAVLLSPIMLNCISQTIWILGCLFLSSMLSYAPSWLAYFHVLSFSLPLLSFCFQVWWMANSLNKSFVSGRVQICERFLCLWRLLFKIPFRYPQENANFLEMMAAYINKNNPSHHLLTLSQYHSIYISILGQISSSWKLTSAVTRPEDIGL